MSAPNRPPAMPSQIELPQQVYGPVSMLARSSLKDVRNLRILLTSLLNKVSPSIWTEQGGNRNSGVGESDAVDAPTATAKPIAHPSDVVSQITGTIDEIKCVVTLLLLDFFSNLITVLLASD